MTDTKDVRYEAAAPEIETLDCSGLLCPMPVYQAALILNRLTAGERLRLITTDPGALRDVPAMARQRGDALLSVVEEESRQIFELEKGSST